MTVVYMRDLKNRLWSLLITPLHITFLSASINFIAVILVISETISNDSFYLEMHKWPSLHNFLCTLLKFAEVSFSFSK